MIQAEGIALLKASIKRKHRTLSRVGYGWNRLKAETGEVGRVFPLKHLARHRKGFGFHYECDE